MIVHEYEVLIIGAGPTGLMLAGELALAGVNVAVVERRPSQDLAGLRAGGLHARTIEILDQRGIADRFLAAGQVAQVAGFAGTRLDISDFPTRHPYGLGLRQNPTERILADWALELGVLIHYGVEAASFDQDIESVRIELSDGSSVRAAYLVGCDGGRSMIRKATGIAFPGVEPMTSHIIAEVEMAEDPPMGLRRDALGQHAIGRVEYEVREGEVVYASEGPVGVMLTEREVNATDDPTLDDLRRALVAVYGTDFGVHSPTWLSRFTDGARLAEAYRVDRVLLAGDAAHVHPPDGGQGLNLGVQDAVNLGWKLALVVKRLAPDSLLDTYHAERHPVGARVLRHALAAVALRRADDRAQAVRDTVAELLALDEPRRHMAAEMSGLGIRYNLGEGHPLLGRRMPDLDLIIAGDTVRACTLLHDALAVLLTFGEARVPDISPWADRVRRVDATYDGGWDLPAIGSVAAPEAVLVRPDGYVAWVDDGTHLGLEGALTTWFGPPNSDDSLLHEPASPDAVW